MPVAITAAQRCELDTVGWTILPAVVRGQELDKLQRAMLAAAAAQGKAGTTFSLRNGLVAHPDLLEMVDNDRVLALVVDVIGWNIQNRDSIFIHSWPQEPPKRRSGSGDRVLSREEVDAMDAGDPGPQDYEEEFHGVTIDGTMPLLDLKASWFLSDHTQPKHGTTMMVNGSFRWDAERRATWHQWLDPADITAIRAPAGSVVLWRPTTLHAVLPHEDLAGPRLALHISYGPRWLRQSFVSSDGEQGQNHALLRQCASPVRQQLLQGFYGDPLELAKLVGSNNRGQTSGSAASQHWFTDDWSTVPLKRWAESRLAPQDADVPTVAEDIMDLRTMNKDFGGHFGATFSKGPGYVFPTKTTHHSLPNVPSSRTWTARQRKDGRDVVRELRKLLPGLGQAQAEALCDKYASIATSAKL